MKEDRFNAYSLLLDRTARRVKQYAQQRFKEMQFNITVDQWMVLKQLQANGAMKQNDLAERLFKDNPTLTRIIDLLCRKELVVRKAHPDDRRSYMVSLTPTGTRKVRELSPRVKAIRLKAWDGLSMKEFNQFRKILDAIYENLAEGKSR